MRRFFRTVGGATALVVAAGALTACEPPPDADALQDKVRAELAVFTDWLDRYDEKGYIGEVGWPDDVRGDSEEWNAAAENWYADADRAGLWVTSWAASSGFGRDYLLSAYEDQQDGPGLDTPNLQAPVLRRHADSNGLRRGVNTGSAEFAAPDTAATSSFSNVNPGSHGSEYSYEPPASFAYMASQGVNTVRMAFRWERIQPQLYGPLDPTEYYRLAATVSQARSAGIDVILDLHNYGAYYLFDGGQGVRRALGSPELPFAAFNDIWTRLSKAFDANPAVIAYGLMNEPVRLPGETERDQAELWERASQSALDAIRARGDRSTVLVTNYFYSNAKNWVRFHPDPWITDPATNYRYEAHAYFNDAHDGHYDFSYQDEVRFAQERGYGP